MFALYDSNWNLIRLFDSDEDAMMYAINNGISSFKIGEM